MPAYVRHVEDLGVCTVGLLGGSLSPKLDNMAVCKRTKVTAALTRTERPGELCLDNISEHQIIFQISERTVFNSNAHFHLRILLKLDTTWKKKKKIVLGDCIKGGFSIHF